MVVVARPLLVALQPVARRLVEVFADVGLAPHVLALHVLLHLGKVEAVGDNGIAVVVEIVGHSRQRLARGEGPHGTIPLALPHPVCAELRVAALGGGQSVGSREALRVGSL